MAASIQTFLLLLLIFDFCHEYSSGQTISKRCGVGIGAAKIVGGTSSSVDMYPWYVALVPANEFSRALQGSRAPLTVFCGASLITSRHAVSAAHCFASLRQGGGNWKSRLVGVLGLSNRCTPTWKSYSSFSDVVIHQNYNPNTVKNDISLISLAKDMSSVTPVCFPPAARHTGDVTIIGYGTTRENTNKAPCTILEAHVIEYTRAECLRTAVAPQIRNLPGVICAGLRNGSADSCQGDSGGPLMYQKKGQFTLEGIVSFGNGCARRNNPGVYTSVAYYNNWIRSRLSNDRVLVAG
ncbi:serine protease [Nesidiocoris tenuis]|uniref:Serine protease n=1 Tax=Nesidiocoris tenuis TaxID=355587 RepID=A0ABN7AVF5_9HEMI|nr:serine protease [Nesidiocoris tenuis]